MSLFRIRTYQEFWPFYLQQHARPITRGLHYFGTTLTIAAALACIATGKLLFLVLIPLGGYGFAWIGHFGFEKNRPATFTYPWWSLISDYRMYFLWLSGGLGVELERANIKVTHSAHAPGHRAK